MFRPLVLRSLPRLRCFGIVSVATKTKREPAEMPALPSDEAKQRSDGGVFTVKAAAGLPNSKSRQRYRVMLRMRLALLGQSNFR
jgi:hypothetical protein